MTDTLAERVKRAREAADLTQFEAAARAGVSLSALTNIEQGITKDPRMSTVERIFSALSQAAHDPDASEASNGRKQNDQAPVAVSGKSSATGAR